ncbi:MAG: isoaspartyl peptidase/L-asparaginase [cyanobacterium endosymbiont of Rhopalodia gibba]
MNVGTRSVFQFYRLVRINACLIDRIKRTFSGVIKVSRLKNTIKLVRFYNSKVIKFFLISIQLD